MALGGNQYRRLLKDIADELTFSDVGSLKFVCRGKIGAAKLDLIPNDKPVQLIKLLEERLLISPKNLTWLQAILKQIKRMDLVIKIPEELCPQNSSDVTDSSAPSTSGPDCRDTDVVPPYRVMLKSISDELTRDNIEEMKFLLYIPDGKAERLTDGQHLLTYLEGSGQISPNNLTGLRSLLNQIHRKDLTNLIEDFSINEVQSQPKSAQQIRDPASCYTMQRPHGYALIINIKSYEGKTKEGLILNERRGSSVDVKKLVNLWKQLGFQVEEHENLKAHHIYKVVHDMAEKIDYNSSCFVCCIMTHGSTMGKIYGSDSEYILISQITELFKEANCPALAGKPKLFFIQACRGRNQLTGRGTFAPTPWTGLTNDATPREEATHATVHEIKQTSRVNANAHPPPYEVTDGDDDEDNGSFRHSVGLNEPHFLLGYSTAPGYVSFRNIDEGTWYVDALVRIFLKHWVIEDLMSMMVKVNGEVSKGYKQCPVPVVTLTKKIYF